MATVVALAAHGSLVYALPSGATSCTEAKPALVWLDAAPLATGATGPSAQQAVKPQAGEAPRVVRKQVKREAEAVARASESPKTVSSATAPTQTSATAPTQTAEAGLELTGAMGTADAVRAVEGPATEQSAQAPGVESGHAVGSPMNVPVLGASGAGALVHGPILRAATGCAGYFPADARAGHGEVEIDVTVDAGGHARESQVLNEYPFGQGFGVAARGCVRTLSFAPAVDRSGAAVSGHAKLRLRFDRPFTT